MPLSKGVARFNRRVTNTLTRRVAGWLPGFAIVVHTGRRSGRAYRTPVNAFRTAGGYRIALTYGADSDWVRNVQAAGGCDLIVRGRHVHLTQPHLVTDAENAWAPPLVRQVLRLTHTTQYLDLSSTPNPQGAA
jgi:deazaflavin-dependent oxidoreductase (nitroreductase family)